MAAATTINALENPSVPEFEPLPMASVPQPPATILTTAQVNGPNGSVDNGGQIDRIAAAAQNPTAQINAWSQQTFGMPMVAPSIQGFLARSTVLILGASMGAIHGYRRSHGKPGPTIGYGIAGALFPLVTLGVAAIQGFALPRRR